MAEACQVIDVESDDEEEALLILQSRGLDLARARGGRTLERGRTLRPMLPVVVKAAECGECSICLAGLLPTQAYQSEEENSEAETPSGLPCHSSHTR